MSLRVVDSHTEGEPTRLVIEGLPELEGSVHDKLRNLKDEHDWVRTMVCLEPRGSEIAVGAAVFPASAPDCILDVVYFDNTSYIGMCGHGTIGVLATLHWLGRIGLGKHRINTVAGVVTAEVHDAHAVTVENVPSFRTLKDAVVDVPRYGAVTGDVAYGGNWFYLVNDPEHAALTKRIPELTEFTSSVMDALWEQGITGSEGARIDHVAVFGGPELVTADSKNFVLCPGKQYDRSPCGTGTSAKMACLYTDGMLPEGQTWTQESIIGSVFRGSVSVRDGAIVPSIQGRAYVTCDSRLYADLDDPYRHGVFL